MILNQRKEEIITRRLIRRGGNSAEDNKCFKRTWGGITTQRNQKDTLNAKIVQFIDKGRTSKH
jgi:hypothetical protein